ncbi:LysR family transcriptional regulator [Tateyamaria omphalii]|uniref:LysR family transcriptional regulator n=1 Tax=Tateyamaria omphalii TaxID=299262 RepID=UPI001C99C0A4|nr:LysR family transcriptional regulator [Tateyamaria omphalii]MBY5933541.1 LysR family transcriptional regulator [Tateyamaria omphalii]
MTIRLLRTLVAVADHKTFTAAAEAVHVSHAAVSQQMQALEADLDLTLFNRATRTPELTPVAHEIVARARVLLADYDNLVPSVLADGGLSGVLKLGALGTTLTGLTPKAVAVFKGRFPSVGLHIRPALTEASLAEIARRNLDAALITKPHLMPAGIVFRPLAEEPMHLIAALEEGENDPLTLLRSRPYIRFNRNAVLGTLIDNWIRARRIRVTETMELDSPEAIASMVHANLGVSIVPDLTVKPLEAVPVRQLSLGPAGPTRVLGLAHLEDQIKTRAIDELFQSFAAVIDEARDVDRGGRT